MITHIIFDFDGTLVDSKEVAISAYNELANKNGFKQIVQEEIDHLKKLSMLERCKALGIPVYKIPFLAPEFYKLYKKSIQDIRLYDGIKEALLDLQQKGYHIGIVSSNDKEIIQEVLKKNELNFIQDIHCSSNLFGKDKIIKAYLKKNKINCANAIYVGDEGRDIVACKQNQLKVVWVSWGYDILESISKKSPDHIVNKPKEILPIIYN
jgi:phosphoglycolate phosphatase